MAILVTNYSCPTEHLAEMGKRVQEIRPKFQDPKHVTVRGPYWKSTLEGMKCFVITEVDPSKMYEERLRMGAFCMSLHGIPGFKWNVEYWTEQTDAQKRIEMFGA
jgi:hypothetical protein